MAGEVSGQPVGTQSWQPEVERLINGGNNSPVVLRHDCSESHKATSCYLQWFVMSGSSSRAAASASDRCRPEIEFQLFNWLKLIKQLWVGWLDDGVNGL